MDIITELNKELKVRDDIDVRPGDTVVAYIKVTEKDRTRMQPFEGTVISVKGSGLSKTITVRKVSYGVGIEKIIPVNSTGIDSIEVKRKGKVRRSKLYYLRGRSKKASRIKEKRTLN